MSMQSTTIWLNEAQLFSIARRFADRHGTCLLHSKFLGLFPYKNVTTAGSKAWEECRLFWEGVPKEALAFGWFSYEMGKEEEGSFPQAYWQQCVVTITLDPGKGTGTLTVVEEALPSLSSEEREWVEKLLQGSIEGLERETAPFFSRFLSFFDQEAYKKKIECIQALIREGEVYQVNLSELFIIESDCPPFALFEYLCTHHPTPFAAYFRHKERAIISASPERFLKKKGDVLESQPIKGTARRGRSVEEDEALKRGLLNSVKEKAELLMITDLVRNDLNKVSLPGSVEVLDLWHCEAYTNVFHLLSRIRSCLRPDVSPIEAVRACFPAGSITGCPKGKAIEYIADLENRSRGLYTGSIGYFIGGGDFDLNVAIRTCVNEKGKYLLQLGGGIVIDSDPAKEAEEILAKGQPIFRSLCL